MSDEHIESLQSSMQFVPTRLPKIVLQRVEEEFPIWREIMVSAMCPYTDKDLYHLILRVCMAQTTKCFLWILCYLSFTVVSYFKDVLFPEGWMYLVALVALAWLFHSANDWLCNRDEWFTVPTLVDFLKVSIVLTFRRRNFLLNFSTPVFEMWIIQEPEKVALWNKRHFEEENTQSMQHV
jgi:hypothetical protein